MQASKLSIKRKRPFAVFHRVVKERNTQTKVHHFNINQASQVRKETLSLFLNRFRSLDNEESSRKTFSGANKNGTFIGQIIRKINLKR